MAESGIAIEAHGLVKFYRHFPVLPGVDLSVRRGACFALFGANGAGETTLVRILCTLLRPTEGRFAIAGIDGSEDREAVREKLFLIAHGHHFYDDLTPLENLKFHAGLRGISLPADAVRGALAWVGLERFADFKIRQFSTGMKKRLAFTQARLFGPEGLLLDEPYTALDEKGVRLVHGFIKEFTAGGGAVFMATHNPDFALEGATDTMLLKNGVLQPIPPGRDPDRWHEIL